MLAGWFARDRRPAIRERKFLNGTYVRNIRSRTCRWVPRLLTCPGIRMHSAFLIDAARRKKVSSLMERVVDKRKGGGNNTFTNCWRSWTGYPSQGFSCFVLFLSLSLLSVLAATAVQEAEGREVGTMDTLSLESFRLLSIMDEQRRLNSFSCLRNISSDRICVHEIEKIYNWTNNTPRTERKKGKRNNSC